MLEKSEEFVWKTKDLGNKLDMYFSEEKEIKNLFRNIIKYNQLKALKSFTYIIGHYNPSVRIIDLASYTTYVVCVIFIYKWRDTYNLKSTPNDRFFLSNFS